MRSHIIMYPFNREIADSIHALHDMYIINLSYCLVRTFNIVIFNYNYMNLKSKLLNI